MDMNLSNDMVLMKPWAKAELMCFLRCVLLFLWLLWAVVSYDVFYLTSNHQSSEAFRYRKWQVALDCNIKIFAKAQPSTYDAPSPTQHRPCKPFTGE